MMHFFFRRHRWRATEPTGTQAAAIGNRAERPSHRPQATEAAAIGNRAESRATGHRQQRRRPSEQRPRAEPQSQQAAQAAAIGNRAESRATEPTGGTGGGHRQQSREPSHRASRQQRRRRLSDKQRARRRLCVLSPSAQAARPQVVAINLQVTAAASVACSFARHRARPLSTRHGREQGETATGGRR